MILFFNDVVNAVTMDQEIFLQMFEEGKERKLVSGGGEGGKKRSISVVFGMNSLNRVNYTS